MFQKGVDDITFHGMRSDTDHVVFSESLPGMGDLLLGQVLALIDYVEWKLWLKGY